jgi:hypothetical protein
VLCEIERPEVGAALREAGATIVIRSIWRLESAVEVAGRRLGSESELESLDSERPMGDGIWDALPWAEFATEPADG